MARIGLGGECLKPTKGACYVIRRFLVGCVYDVCTDTQTYAVSQTFKCTCIHTHITHLHKHKYRNQPPGYHFPEGPYVEYEGDMPPQYAAEPTALVAALNAEMARLVEEGAATEVCRVICCV